MVFGTLIALALHSFVEVLELYGFLGIEFLLRIMPMLVLIGSIFFILGTYELYKTITRIK